MRIDPDRLYASLAALGEIGAYTDERTGLRGVNRLALTAADGDGRRHVVERMRALGLAITVDQIGNVYGRRAGQDESLAPVMMGSHIDSVPTAGQFDGCLGVLGGLEVIATLNAHAITTHRPMVVAFFTDEEGCRFGTDMLGSAVATGRLRLEDVYELRDLGGARLRDELESIGFLGPADPHLRWPHAYLECHVEQGPLLGAKGVEIGVVSGVQGISWHELTLLGASAHAGTTPMALRHDSGFVAARINVFLRELTTRIAGARATMGCIQPNPGLVNIIPGRTIATIDLRNPDEGRLRQMEAEVFAFCAEAAAEEGVELRRRQTARTPPVDFAPELQERIAAAADDLGLSRTALISGAGHDAQEFARICPTAMIFVPGEFQGISHNPRELSTREQCANGVNVLLQVARELAG